MPPLVNQGGKQNGNTLFKGGGALMKIIKQFDERFTTICNEIIFRKDLSMKAKALYTMMMALPDTWNYSIKGLAAMTKEGVAAINSALKELRTIGYVTVNRVVDDKGKVVDWNYTIYQHLSMNPDAENPDLENPDVDNPDLENQRVLNTNLSITEKPNTDESIEKDISSVPSDISKEKPRKRSSGVNPSLEEVQAFIEEKHLHVSAESIIGYYTNHGDHKVWRFKDGSLVKDWHRCIYTFEERWRERNKPRPDDYSDNILHPRSPEAREELRRSVECMRSVGIDVDKELVDAAGL